MAPTNTSVRNNEGIANYTNFWQKDSKDDTEVELSNRLSEYTSVVNGYYDGATDLYEFGWSSNFHFARYYLGEAFMQAIARHEHYLVHQMTLKRNMRVLDVGCGVGGPAREIARFADVKVIGVNNNDYQLQRAQKLTKQAGLSDQVKFVKADFMKLDQHFPENSFDAIYAIEATCHAPDFEGIYGQILKLLKPGGVFGVYEWCMTDNWDPKDPEHKRIAHGIEIGDGIPEMRNIKAARNALRNVGFQIEHEEDLADRDDPIPWYYPIAGHLHQCQTFWDYFTVIRMTKIGRATTQVAVKALELIGMVPKGTHAVGNSLITAADALVAGGQSKLFTPMMLFIARKPAN